MSCEYSRAPQAMDAPSGKAAQLTEEQFNLKYDPRARIQTGPAEPEWSWNQVRCSWNGPVTSDQKIRPIFIPRTLHRVLTVVRIVFLLLLAAILLGLRWRWNPFSRRRVSAALALCCFLAPSHVWAQFPDQQMLDTLQKRLLEPSDAFPQAAEIAQVELKLNQNRIVMETEIHAVLRSRRSAARPPAGLVPVDG